MTEARGEGMVVKPMDFICQQGNKLIQPAVKCRGAEYLRIIYGLEYSLPEHLKRLKQRGLSKKRCDPQLAKQAKSCEAGRWHE